MIVRTYGRRNRSMNRTCSDSAFDDAVSDFSSQESPQDIYSFDFSSQDSTHWQFDSEPYASNSSQESRQFAALPPKNPVVGDDLEYGAGARKSKKARNGKREIDGVMGKKVKKKGEKAIVAAMATATLMETQEFGEMMEHSDEVTFALDGLRKGLPVRIRRASLLSLLSICGTVQQRRLLRTNGTTKTIIDAILGLSFDDSPSNLAAAALLYILTSDGQDDNLLDSPSCIRFLIKLLKPLVSDATKAKIPSIGSKLLALRKDAAFLQDSKGVDATSTAIMVKVQEMLVSCKEMNSRDWNDKIIERPELSPKWIALLTLEKACLSTISLEDTSGTVRKTGGNFKEKFREHGGLDTVVEVAKNCHSVMEGWLEQRSSSILESQNRANLESLVLLLKCLKIMENATFLSMDNQSHLLGMKGNFDSQRSPQFFTKLVLSVINILSGVSLLISSSSCSDDENFSGPCGAGHASEGPSAADNRVESDEILSISSSVRCCSMEGTSSSQKRFNISQGGQSVSGSCSGTSKSFNNGTLANNMGLSLNLGFGKRTEIIEDDTKFELFEDSQEDPFAFHDDEFEPSKWDLLYGTQKVSQTQKSRARVGELEDGCQSLVILSQQESSNKENNNNSPPDEVFHKSAADKEKANLLAECLLSAVKVLMNLTNDNPVGCQQIAASGGLETLSSLIACHFPSFSSYLPPFNNVSSITPVEVDSQNGGKHHRTDQESDFLVAILGLLVNLVEKDGRNRSRLAAASVSLPSLEGGSEDEGIDVISLLCCIFLANQGAGEATEEGKHSSGDEEDIVLQGEKEAEKMIIEAYAALLLAFLSTESKSIRNAISECLPDHKLAILVPVLERFVEFHLALNMISPETHTTVLEVIESCRIP
ncbi:hypothetical protein LguiA_025227 [Lonicera macranthoides]